MKNAKVNRRKVAKKPRKLRMPSFNWTRAFMPIGFLGAFVAIGLCGKILLDHPVQHLEIESSFQRVTPIQVEAAIVSELTGGFLSAKLGNLQDHIESLDWVKSAEIARRWPGTLVVRVKEHQAAARWGQTGLLNTNGELFTENSRYAFPELPRLVGPNGTEREVATRYLGLRSRLVEANLVLKSLVMDSRGSWLIKLDGGQEIRIGRRDVDERLDLLFQVVTPSLADQFHRIQHVDLRYTNGFSVSWISDQGIQLAQENEGVGNG